MFISKKKSYLLHRFIIGAAIDSYVRVCRSFQHKKYKSWLLMRLESYKTFRLFARFLNSEKKKIEVIYYILILYIRRVNYEKSGRSVTPKYILFEKQKFDWTYVLLNWNWKLYLFVIQLQLLTNFIIKMNKNVLTMCTLSVHVFFFKKKIIITGKESQLLCRVLKLINVLTRKRHKLENSPVSFRES